MAFLRKKKGSPNWFGVFKDGRFNVEKSMKTDNKHEAQRRLARWSVDLERSFHKRQRKITFNDLADKWIETQETPDKKERTLFSYKERLRVHIKPFFGDRSVDAIKPETIERFKVEMTKKTIIRTRIKREIIDGEEVKVFKMIDGEKVYVKERVQTNKALSSTSINYCLRILSSIMNAAVKWEYLHTNPVKLVKRLKQAKYKNHVPSKEEMMKLIEKANGMTKTVILFAIASGMRLGEILGAKWKFLDLDKGTYSVKESYSEFGLDKPKTEASFRLIHLPASLVHELKKHKLKTGSQSKEGLIFHAGDGEYIDPHNFRNRIYYPLLDKAELPRSIRFHDLRGLCATLLLESGASLKHVMEHLGHRSPNMTLGVYASVSQGAREEIAQKLEAHMFGQLSPQEHKFSDASNQ